MNWKDILKVDNVIFDPKENASAFYDPSTKEITLNLAKFPYKGDSEEKIIADLDLIVTHEAAHKAVDSVLEERMESFVNELGQHIVDVLNRKEGSQTKMIDTGMRMMEMIAVDEAYAYSTGATTQRKPKIAIMESTADSFLGAMNDILGQIAEQIKSHRQEYGEEITKNSLKILTAIARDFQDKTLAGSAIIEQSVSEFVSRMNNMSDEEKYEYTTRTAQKIKRVPLSEAIRTKVLDYLDNSSKLNVRRG